MDRRYDDPPVIDIRVGQRINLRRSTLGLSQLLLAQRLGISIDTVETFESGFSRPTATQVINLCHALEIAPSWLFADDPIEDED